MTKRFRYRRGTHAAIASVLAVSATHLMSAAFADSAPSASARIGPYLMASQQQEVSLARSAAPPSISMHATVMVLGARGYVTAVEGSNGFVCLVQRSWDNALSVKRTRFWNPRIRSDFCYNAAGAQSVLPEYLMRTRWVLAGASMAEIGERDKAAWAAGKVREPAAGAMCYMMSKHSWGVGGNPGPWRPHLMFYYPRGHAPNWGANLGGSPVLASADDHTTVFVVLVPVWSDESPAPSF